MTPVQKRLISELNNVAEAAGMDFWNAQNRASGRTEFLQMALRQFVNARIIARYTMIDEYLTMIICDFYFRRRKGESSYGRLWKNDAFRIFNHFLLDEAFTINKMNMVKAIGPLSPEGEHITTVRSNANEPR
jgi:hypothetical protein